MTTTCATQDEPIPVHDKTLNRAAVLTGAGAIRLDERLFPVPGPHEVVVRISVVGVCGSNVHYYEHGRIGARAADAPRIFSHEAACTVAFLGQKVTKHGVGDPVAIDTGVPCGRCRECPSGRHNLGADMHFLATPPVHGAFTDHLAETAH